MNPFEEGYYSGMVNDRECPHWFGTPSWLMWQLGNDIGVAMHCAAVEAVYTTSNEGEY